MEKFESQDSQPPVDHPMLRVLVFCFWAAIIQMVLHAALLHFTIVHLGGAQEYREGAVVDTTHMILEGVNPYTAEQLPTHTNVYGMTLSALMAMLSPWIEPTLGNHRVVVGFLIIAACGLLVSIARASRISPRESLVCGLIFYVLINLSYSVIARPDAAGLVFMLGGVRCAMITGKWKYAGWGISILCACAAFFTKPYFVFGAGCSAVFIGWHFGLRKALIFWGAIVLTLTGSILLATSLWPLYWFSTFEIHRASNSPDLSHFQSQWLFFALSHLGLVIASLFIIPSLIRRGVTSGKNWKSTCVSCWQTGFDKVVPGNWSGFCALTAAGILGISLAWHQGAYYIYFVHLLTPFLILAIFSSFKQRSISLRMSGGKMVSLPANALIITAQVVVLSSLLRPVPVMDFDNYLAWKSLLDPQKKVLAPPLLVPELIEKNMPYPDNGQTEFFLASSLAPGSNTNSKAEMLSKNFLDNLRQKVKSGYYDRIIMAPGFFSHYFSREAMQEKYELRGTGYYYSYYGLFNRPWKYGDARFSLEVWELSSQESEPALSQALPVPGF